ncbi:MAG: methylenetetrahydrofolate reductase [NAD(P)H], partial [Pirellulales bacterium]
MASLASFYTADRKGLSFELFPPKTEKGDAALLKHVERLSEFKPDYVTCTYGAGGSTQGKTLDIVSAVKQQFNVPVASHLTCVGSTREDLRQYLNDVERRDIDYIVALRGDPPQGATTFKAVEGGLQYANELVELIDGEFPNLGIAVAGYPEVHQEASSADIDLDNLKRKVDCGADIVITQLFYGTEDYFDFCDRCVTAGITVPIVPGILPVINLAQIQRITSMCGAKLPQPFVDRLSEHCDDDDWQFKVGVEFATAQVSELLATGAPGVHFY